MTDNGLVLATVVGRNANQGVFQRQTISEADFALLFPPFVSLLHTNTHTKCAGYALIKYSIFKMKLCRYDTCI